MREKKFVYEAAKKDYPSLPYHNYRHALEVAETVRKYGKYEGASKRDLDLLETAALLHDVIYEKGKKNNEERSAEYAERLLKKADYSKDKIKTVGGLILATKLPTSPSNLIECIICDADLDYLGREYFFEKNEKFRIENGFTKEKNYELTLKFLESHKYYTEFGKKHREPKLKENIARLKRLLNDNLSWREMEKCL